MVGLVSFGNNRSYEDFKKQIPDTILPLFEDIRNYCLSIADSVVEDVRMHRIVFCKSISFRWFADVAPEEDSIIIKIQKSRKDPHRILQIKSLEQFHETKSILKDAFESIH